MDYMFGVTTEWIVKEFLPRGYLAILAAEPKAGKTCFATSLSLAVATGTDFGGLPVNQGAVLWLAGEESPQERRLFWRDCPLVDWATPLFTCYEHISIDTDEGIWALEQWITRVNATLVVIDPLHAATSGRSLQDGWSARKTLAKLKTMCATNNVSCVVLHHSSRRASGPSKKVAESAQLSATASLIWLLRSRPTDYSTGSDEAKRLVTIECQGRGDFANQLMQFSSSGPLNYVYLGAKVQPDPVLPRNTANRRVITELAKKPMTATQLIDAIPGLQPGTIRNTLCNLVKANSLRVVRKRRGARVYGLPENTKRIMNDDTADSK